MYIFIRTLFVVTVVTMFGFQSTSAYAGSMDQPITICASDDDKKDEEEEEEEEPECD